MTWLVALIGVIIALINVYYGISKDNAQKGEAEIKECVETLKKAFQDSLDDKKHYKHHIAYVEGLTYIRLVKENSIDNLILCFACSISDFCENSISEEDLLSSYKTTIEAIYNMRFSTIKYVCYILKQGKK